MCLRFTGKTFEKYIELSMINGFETGSHETGQMPISNRLRPIEIFERVRCASGWSHIYNDGTNPVNAWVVWPWFEGRRGLCVWSGGRDTVKPANSNSDFWFFVTAVVSALCFEYQPPRTRRRWRFLFV